MKKHLYTNVKIFKLIMNQLQSENRVPDILDYDLATHYTHELRDYAFDVIGHVNYGGSEGIYVDLFCQGNIGGKDGAGTYDLGTIKTLRTDDDAFRQMAVLMADFQIAATRFVNAHLDDFTWTGYDIDYFRAGETERSYGITEKAIRNFDEAIEEAKRTMKRFPYYVKAVITHNADEKTKTVYGCVTEDVPVVCDHCGRKFWVTYHYERGLKYYTYGSGEEPCECRGEAEFHPVEGYPSIDEWARQFNPGLSWD